MLNSYTNPNARPLQKSLNTLIFRTSVLTLPHWRLTSWIAKPMMTIESLSRLAILVLTCQSMSIILLAIDNH
ncbi:hypothetical protein DmLsi_07780 [Lactiplantibacillus plantarum]|nr:hypothetical protein DmLsi_07780 [Lactiplantibacillus plantarum]